MADRCRTVLLFGAPGVGKGTQGRVLGSIPGFYHLSCGDVFRQIDIGSNEGSEIYGYSSRGELVPDELTIRIWQKGLHGQIATSSYKPHEDLLILDGIPRNPNQAKLMEDLIDVLKVIYLVCSDEEAMIHRIRRRAIRENRADDANEQVIRKRFEVYHRESAPVLGYYDDDKVARVEALGSPAEVLKKILEQVIPVQNEHFRRSKK